jgi:hypothetical protein
VVQEEEKKSSTSALKQRKQDSSSMSDEEKNEQMKKSLESLIDQMEPRMRTFEERRNIDRLRHMLPLYEKHSFWES